MPRRQLILPITNDPAEAPSLVDQTTSLVDQPALVKTPQEFSLDSFLSTPPGFDGLTNIPATPREAFNLIAQASVNREDHQNPKSVYPNQANQPHTRCQCLNTVAVLLEELEAKSKLVDPAALDSILASQKEALGRCNSVLSCTTCFPKPEYILLLGMVTERLACLCEATVTKYLEEAAQRQSNSVTEASNGRHHSRTSSAGSGGAKVFLGSYEIESPEEYNGVIRFLIALQLQSLRKFIEGMKKAAGTGPSCASQLPKVQAAEKRVAKLIQKIRLQPTGKLGSEGRANGAVMSSL